MFSIIMLSFIKVFHIFQRSFQSSLLQISCMWVRVNPFPPADTFWRNNSRWLLKPLWPKVKLLMMSNFYFGNNVFNFILQLSYPLWRFFILLWLCFQSPLLQICCKWERVKESSRQLLKTRGPCGPGIAHLRIGYLMTKFQAAQVKNAISIVLTRLFYN